MWALLVLAGTPVTTQELPESTIPPPIVENGGDALVALTRDSGNPGFGALMSQLIALEMATAPLLSSASGFAFLLDDVAEAQTSRLPTFGPLLLERGLTSGHLATTLGLMTTTTSYDSVSDRSLDGLRLASFTGPSPVVGSSTLDLSVQAVVATAFARIGLGERLDIAVALPVLSLSLDGVLTQEERATGTAVLSISHSSVGIGDLALMGKLRAWKSADDLRSLAAVVTVRAPTGAEEHLRGVDAWRTMVAGTGTWALERVTLHASGGYEFWDKGVDLLNVLPNGLVETWTLADQFYAGAGLEVAAHSAVSVSVDVVRREIVDGGRLEPRVVAAPVPALGIDTAEILAAGPGRLQALTVAVGARWSPAEFVTFTLGAVTSPSNTGLQSIFTPMLGVTWTFCKEC